MTNDERLEKIQECYSFHMTLVPDSDLCWLINRVGALTEAFKRIEKHGCCIMHNDDSCPGCTAKIELKEGET